MSDDGQGSATKICHACASEIPAAARVCKECGSWQSNDFGKFGRFAAQATVVATILSIISTGVALFPKAISYLIRDPEPRLVEIVFDNHDPRRRTLGTFALYNGGNVDAFATKLELRPKNTLFDGVGGPDLKIYERIFEGKGFEKDIAFEGARLEGRFKPHWLLISEKTFPDVIDILKEERLPVDKCTVFFPFNARLGLGPPKSGEFRNKDAVTSLKGTLLFIDPGRPKKVEPSKVENLYIEAAVYLDPRCAYRLGGKGRVEGVIRYRQQQRSP